MYEIIFISVSKMRRELVQAANSKKGMVLKKNDRGHSSFSKCCHFESYLFFGLIQTVEADIKVNNA